MKKLFFLFIIIVAQGILPGLPTATRAQAPQANDYDIRLPGADGKTYDLTTMRGHVLLVSFGATWCQPCKEELRALEQLKDEYKSKPVKFFWVTIEPEEQVSDGTLKSFARSVKFTFPILRDATRWTYAQFSTRQRIPLVVFFDKSGRFVAPAHAGMSSPEKYKQMVRATLDKLLADNSNTNVSPSGARSSN